MKRGPIGAATAVDYPAKARTSWGEPIPAWVLRLAEEARAISASAVAERLGYRPSVISEVISRTYRGRYDRVETAVRGALMGETVDCPVVGEIGTDRCRIEQKEPFRATSAMRAQLFHACQTCSNREVKS